MGTEKHDISSAISCDDDDEATCSTDIENKVGMTQHHPSPTAATTRDNHATINHAAATVQATPSPNNPVLVGTMTTTTDTTTDTAEPSSRAIIARRKKRILATRMTPLHRPTIHPARATMRRRTVNRNTNYSAKITLSVIMPVSESWDCSPE